MCWRSHEQLPRSWGASTDLRGFRARLITVFHKSTLISQASIYLLCPEVIKGFFWTLVGKTNLLEQSYFIRGCDDPPGRDQRPISIKAILFFLNSAVARLTLAGLIGNFLVMYTQALWTFIKALRKFGSRPFWVRESRKVDHECTNCICYYIRS